MVMVNQNPMDHKIALRKSQIKFESDSYSFEVCGVNSYSQGYLNCQTVLLFHSLGAPLEYFVDLSYRVKEYSKIRNMQEFVRKNILNKTNMDVQKVSQELKLFLTSLNSLENQFHRALFSGFDIQNDPFLS